MNLAKILKHLKPHPELLIPILKDLDLAQKEEETTTFEVLLAAVDENLLCECLPKNANTSALFKIAAEHQKFEVAVALLKSHFEHTKSVHKCMPLIHSIPDYANVAQNSVYLANPGIEFDKISAFFENIKNVLPKNKDVNVMLLEQKIRWCINFADLQSLKTLSSEMNFKNTLISAMNRTPMMAEFEGPAINHLARPQMMNYLETLVPDWAQAKKEAVSNSVLESFKNSSTIKDIELYLQHGVLDTLEINVKNNYSKYNFNLENLLLQGKTQLLTGFYNYTDKLKIKVDYEVIELNQTEMHKLVRAYLEDQKKSIAQLPEEKNQTVNAQSLMTVLKGFQNTKNAEQILEKILLSDSVANQKNHTTFKL